MGDCRITCFCSDILESCSPNWPNLHLYPGRRRSCYCQTLYVLFATWQMFLILEAGESHNNGLRTLSCGWHWNWCLVYYVQFWRLKENPASNDFLEQNPGQPAVSPQFLGSVFWSDSPGPLLWTIVLDLPFHANPVPLLARHSSSPWVVSVFYSGYPLIIQIQSSADCIEMFIWALMMSKDVER